VVSDMDKAIDSEGNGIFGMMVAIWSFFFL
jgi:hypothetical protein